MNINQRIVIIVVGIVLLGMLAYPPFHLDIQKGTFNRGFSFIFDPPGGDSYTATINVIQLLVQEIIIGTVGGLGWFLLKK
jgi:NADPH:quinone reductase-like Zn-dependent oxidoreductase